MWKRRKRRRQIGTMTTFLGLKAWRQYLTGKMTLEEFQRTDLGVISEPIYEDEIK